MHKRSAASTMRFPEHASRASDRGQRRAHYAVIRWRLARDNQRRERPVRDVRTFPVRARADAAYRAWLDAQPTLYVVLCDDSGVLVAEGEPSIVEWWVAERRGVNAAADPYSAAGYMRREQADDRAMWTDDRHGMPDDVIP